MQLRFSDYLADKEISMMGSDAWRLEPYDFAQGAPASFACAPGTTGSPGDPVTT
jgi:hypothetical protein